MPGYAPDNPNNLLGNYPELIVSPVPFEKWGSTWRLTAVLKDRLGLVNDVLTILKEHDFRVLCLESASDLELGHHFMEILIELPIGIAPYLIGQSELGIDKIKEYSWYLETLLFDDLTYHISGAPRIKLRSVRSLRMAYHAHHHFSSTSHKGNSFRLKPLQERVTVETVRDGAAKEVRLRLPSEMRQMIAQASDCELADLKRTPGFYFRVSDTKDRMLRVYFSQLSDPFLHTTFTFNTQLGAITRITNVLRDNKINIIASRCSSHAQEKVSEASFLLLCDPSAGTDSHSRKSHLQRIFGKQDIQDLDLQIYTTQKESLTPLPPIARAKTAKSPSNSHRAVVLTSESRTLANLHNAGEQLQSKIRSDFELQQDDIAKYRHLLRLKSKGELIGIGKCRYLFLSCSFDDRTNINTVRKLAEDQGFTVLTGEDLKSGNDICSILRDRISSCTHFLGIWAEPEMSSHESVNSISPYLTWELGVAEAYLLRWHLVIPKTLDSRILRLHGDIPHTAYGSRDFEQRVTTALQILGSKPADPNCHALRDSGQVADPMSSVTADY